MNSFSKKWSKSYFINFNFVFENYIEFYVATNCAAIITTYYIFVKSCEVLQKSIQSLKYIFTSNSVRLTRV